MWDKNNENHLENRSGNREREREREKYIVGCRGASQLGGSSLGIPPGYKANK